MTKPESPIPAGPEIQAMRDTVARIRARLSPEDHARLADMVEILAELRAVVSESDDDMPADETLLAQAIERARRSR